MADSPNPECIFCTCCGRSMPLGSLYYHISLRVEAAFDGYLDVDELLAQKSSKAQIQETILQLRHRSAESLRKDVTQVLTAQLCVSCKNAVLGLIFGQSSIS